jgi:aryl-alcohol dehydrogenase-like predicted oxidoreductase
VHETDGLIDTAKELGIAYVAYSPLGHGWLVDDFKFKTPDDFAPDDFRRGCEYNTMIPCFCCRTEVANLVTVGSS